MQRSVLIFIALVSFALLISAEGEIDESEEVNENVGSVPNLEAERRLMDELQRHLHHAEAEAMQNPTARKAFAAAASSASPSPSSPESSKQPTPTPKPKGKKVKTVAEVENKDDHIEIIDEDAENNNNVHPFGEQHHDHDHLQGDGLDEPFVDDGADDFLKQLVKELNLDDPDLGLNLQFSSSDIHGLQGGDLSRPLGPAEMELLGVNPDGTTNEANSRIVDACHATWNEQLQRYDFAPDPECFHAVFERAVDEEQWEDALWTVEQAMEVDAHHHMAWQRLRNATQDHIQSIRAQQLPEFKIKPVDVRPNLTLTEFLDEYAAKNIPVVIPGIGKEVGVSHWTRSYLKEKCADMEVIPLKDAKGEGTWAGLVKTYPMTVKEFIDQNENETAHLYIHDEPLPLKCPEIMKDFSVPKYFVNDFLQRIPLREVSPKNRTLMIGQQRAWPSLFIGKKGTRSHLHLDDIATHFWMIAIDGEKTWTIIPFEDFPLLGPNERLTQFGFDASAPDYKKYPLSRYASGWRHQLQPGELIYVPSRSLHQVENPVDTVAISGNHVDIYNIDNVLADCQMGVKPDYRWIIRVFLNDPVFNRTMDRNVGHIPWKKWEKRTHRYTDAWLKQFPDIYDRLMEFDDTQ